MGCFSLDFTECEFIWKYRQPSKDLSNIFVVPDNYDTLSAEEKATAWKNVDNPSMSTRLTCVFVSDRQVPQTIPEEPSVSFDFYDERPCENFDHSKKILSAFSHSLFDKHSFLTKASKAGD